MAQQALAVYQNFLYSFWSSWKIFLGSFLNPHTIYKTAHLKVFYWLLDVPSVAFCVDLSLFYAEEHIEMLSLWSPFCTERKKVARSSNSLVAVRARSQQLFNHRNYLVASARLALLLVVNLLRCMNETVALCCLLWWNHLVSLSTRV